MFGCKIYVRIFVSMRQKKTMCYCKNEEFSQLLHGFIALVSKRVGGSSKCSQIMNIIHIKSSFEVEYVNTQKSRTTRRNIYSLADKEGRRSGDQGGP